MKKSYGLVVRKDDTCVLYVTHMFLYLFFFSRMCTLEVNKLVADVTRVIKVLYGSLHK